MMNRELESFGFALAQNTAIGRGLVEVSRSEAPKEIECPFPHAPVLPAQRDRNHPNECTFFYNYISEVFTSY